MVKFSANLGFLWADIPLPAAILAAKSAGFDAVECHWPYDTAATEIVKALDDTGLAMLGINTFKGDDKSGGFGLSAVPGQQAAARLAIDQAIFFAAQIGAEAVHVMAGKAAGAGAKTVFEANLTYACTKALNYDLTILIEPLNPYDAPGYFLNSLEQAAQIIARSGLKNLKLMFDCYHVGRTEGDIIGHLRALYPIIGHIQFASVPSRQRPDQGKVDFAEIFSVIDGMGWTRPIGAEYKPIGKTEDSLGWMQGMGRSSLGVKP